MCGIFGYILLTTVGHNANDCIYLVAYVVVKKENMLAWRWFMKYLSNDIQIGSGDQWTFMTDRQKGLQNVINEMFPEVERRFCVHTCTPTTSQQGIRAKL